MYKSLQRTVDLLVEVVTTSAKEAQGIGSEATADADINPGQSTVIKMGNATIKLKQKLWTDPDCNNSFEHKDEAEHAVNELECDQTIDSVEEMSFEDAWSDDTSAIPLVASLENSQTPDMTPLAEKSSKERAEHPNFAESGGLNGAICEKNMVTISSMSILGEEAAICSSIHKINEAQKGQGLDDVYPIHKNPGKNKNLISDHSSGGKSCHSRRRSERLSTQTHIIMTRSMRKTAESADAFTTPQEARLENSVKSAGVVACGNKIENLTGKGEGENKRTLGRHRSENVKIKKQRTREDCLAEETNVQFSPQDADKLANSTHDNNCGEKSHLSKKGRKQRSGLTRTISNYKNFHHSARPTFKACTSKAESHPKAAALKRERKTSQGDMPKLRLRRRLDYDQETACAPENENKTATSQSLVFRTSRSGRVLLPTMEFWRNQLPI